MRKSLIFLLILFTIFCNNTSYCQKVERQQLVILLDVSNSMNTSDPHRKVIEGIKEIIHTLPSTIKVSLVTYDKEISNVIENLTPDALDSLDDIRYKSYSNAGLGLKTAVELIESNGRVLLINDGEIRLHNKQETNESIDLFQSYIEIAKEQEIVIDTVFINEEYKLISDGVAITNGSQYFVGKYNDFRDVIKDLLYQNYELSPKLLLKKSVSPTLQKIDIPLDKLQFGNLKIILTSTVPLDDLAMEVEATKTTYYKQSNTYIYTMSDIQSDVMTFLFRPKETGIINIYSQSEYTGDIKLATEISYIDTVEKEVGKREAQISLWLEDSEHNNLLTQEALTNMNYTLSIGNEIIASNFNNEIIKFTFDVDDENSHSLDLVINYSDAIIQNKYHTELKLELFDYEPPKKFYQNPYIVGGLLFFLFSAIYIVYKKKTTTEFEIISKKGYPFTGKLNIYMTSLADDEDYPPCSYMLYRAFSRSELSLKEIFDLCDIRISAKGLNGISIAPAQDGGIYIYNNSDATVMVKREIVIKGTVCLCHYGDKVYITFEDKKTEAELHYKNVKPSEM